MEPMLLPDGDSSLDDVSFDLMTKASGLASRLHPVVQTAVGDLVRSMNCYYSNLIEGHDTKPRDIDRALNADYAKDSKRRELQLEAVAHIEVQRLIDSGNDPHDWPATETYARWLHREFCSRLPAEFLLVRSSTREVRVDPGELRRDDVTVGEHEPPPHADLPRFMRRFDDAFARGQLTQIGVVRAIPAIHHRFAWIHPFIGGNGRVARLMSHALLKRMNLGSSLWAVSRGLARSRDRYRDVLQDADEPRRGELDGRGNLSLEGLRRFCRFFLEVCVDQVVYMDSVLSPNELLRRIEIWAAEETAANRLPRGAYAILREAVLAGELPRGEVERVLGVGERAARNVTSALVERKLLIASSHRAPLRIGFPIDVVERWFPLLYPSIG